MNCTPLEFRILRSLARHRFLTNRQLVFLTGATEDYVSRITRRLSRTPRKKPYLHVRRFPVHAQLGRLEYLYSLTNAGATFLTSHRVHVPVADATTTVELDYFHRKAVIDFDLYLDRALLKTGFHVAHRQHYYEYEGANHTKKQNAQTLTSVNTCKLPSRKYFVPDTIFVLEREEPNAHMLGTLEYVRGQKRQRTLRQIERHLQALESGALNRMCGVAPAQGFLSLFVLEEPSLLNRIHDSLRTDPTFGNWQAHFLFTTMKDYLRSPLTCWLRPSEPEFRFDLLTGKRYKNS